MVEHGLIELSVLQRIAEIWIAFLTGQEHVWSTQEKTENSTLHCVGRRS